MFVKQQSGVAERLAPQFEELVVVDDLVLAIIIKASVFHGGLLKVLECRRIMTIKES